MSQSVWIEQPCPEQTKRTYYYQDGSYLTKEGGTVAWRNNNEGNLRPGALSSSRIGVDKKNFAVFATPEDGRSAKKYLLFSSSSYKNLSLKDAIKRYAPGSDNNDPVKYASFVMSNGKVDNKVMGKYSADEQIRIMDAMKIQEGYKVGSEIRGNTSKIQQQTTSTVSSESLDYDSKSAIEYNKKLSYSVTQWKAIQNKLNSELQLKNPLVADGIPGKLTADAVYKYQVKKGMKLKDGKCGNGTLTSLGLASTSTATKSTNTQTNSGKKITIPSGSAIMNRSYTPDLDLLNRHAIQEGYDVKDVATSANYVAKYCTGSGSQHQCTRGTALFLQLASYARGEAKPKYATACPAHLFGSANKLTNYNISGSVAGEYSKSSAPSKTGKSNMNSQISANLKKDGEFVTFQYENSQHIVFHSNGGWYSDFKQGTPAGCGGSKTTYSNVHYFTK